MGIIAGNAFWPGIASIVDCSYTTSHGLSPGVAILRALPQTALPAETGTLAITDSNGVTISMPDCKLDVLRVEDDGNGFVWSLAIRDRRWKWLDLGQISGWYNQVDEHGKLVPWTIRSPKEIAALCLDAMGEKNYTIDLPPGLEKKDGIDWIGAGNPPWINPFPPGAGKVNPPINWPAGTITPAQALDQLCQMLGRVIVYRWSSNSVAIVEPGKGSLLPNGSIARDIPSLKKPPTPTGVAAAGSPTKYQGRFLLEAVGEEWDGSYRPINKLSYAPREPGTTQIIRSTVRIIDGNSACTFQIFINADRGEAPTTGTLFEYAFAGGSSDPEAVATLVASNFADQINASLDPAVVGVVTATAVGATVIVTGVVVGHAWQYLSRVDTAGSSSSFVFRRSQTATDDEFGWYLTDPGPGGFANARETDRLTYIEAVRLARKSVFRCYRVMNVDVTGKGPIRVPGYKPTIKRRQQLFFLPTQVDQVTPQPHDEKLREVRENVPLTVNFYNGYSRDKPAAVYGSIAEDIGCAFWVENEFFPNTPPKKQVFVDFNINSNERLDEQIVHFHEYVYQWTDKGVEPPNPLILQTGVHIRNEDTNAFECYAAKKFLPGMSGNTNFAIRKFEDVQLFITSTYKDDGVTIDKVKLLEEDAIARANHYVDGLTKQYEISGAETRVYNGLIYVDLDGAIAQISWSVGGEGAMTTASRNSEHHPAILPFPARRRAEFLGPAQQANLINAIAKQRNIGPGRSMNEPG